MPVCGWDVRLRIAGAGSSPDGAAATHLNSQNRSPPVSSISSTHTTIAATSSSHADAHRAILAKPLIQPILPRQPLLRPLSHKPYHRDRFQGRSPHPRTSVLSGHRRRRPRASRVSRAPIFPGCFKALAKIPPPQVEYPPPHSKAFLPR